MIFSLQIATALCIDIFCGDPKWLYHPVRAIGALCIIFESLTRKVLARFGMRFCGIVTFFLVLGSSLSILFFLFYLLVPLNSFWTTAGAVILLYMAFAAGDLLAHSRQVYSSLSRSDISRARSDVAQLVGRETDHLDETEITRACVESVAENLVDGITAPLFWSVLAAFLLGGIYFEPIVWAVAGAYFYKTVNTMDSMFGYKNERYLKFGWLAARFDDLMNYIPARLSSLFIVLAAVILQLDYKNSAKILFRDRLKNSSPNSGYPEAAVSGALNIELGGNAVYFGQKTEGPLIGAGQRSALPGDIKEVNKLALAVTIVFSTVLLLVYNLSAMIYS